MRHTDQVTFERFRGLMLTAHASVHDIPKADWDRLANPPGLPYNPLSPTTSSAAWKTPVAPWRRPAGPAGTWF